MALRGRFPDDLNVECCVVEPWAQKKGSPHEDNKTSQACHDLEATRADSGLPALRPIALIMYCASLFLLVGLCHSNRGRA